MNLKKIWKKFEILFFIVIFILIDLITKSIFIKTRFCNDCMIYIRGMYNFGTSVGTIFGPHTSTILFYLTFIFIIMMLIYRNFFINNKYLKWCYILIISGASANAIDRYLIGAVRDFIGIATGSANLFIFNIADVYVFLALFCYAIFYFDHFEIHHKHGIKKRSNKTK